MSKIKQAIYASAGVEEVDVTPEGLDALEAKGAALILDWQTFAREYNPIKAGMPVDEDELEQE
jgi:hypothetical protein